MLRMMSLSKEGLIKVTKLGYDGTLFNQILKQNVKRLMRFMMRKVNGVDVFFFQAEDGIRDLVRSRGLGDVYKGQAM